MSVFDTTAVDLAAKGANVAATPPVEGKPVAPTEGKKDAAPPAEKRPETTDLINSIMEKHGLTSPDELGDFVDGLAGLKGKIGDNDLDELIKAKETLTAYRDDWARQERAKQKENESAEETIARLEKELQEEQHRKVKAAESQKQASEAKKALKSYAEVVSSTIKADPSIPPQYHSFFLEFMGVDSPVNDLDIRNKTAAVKLAKASAVKFRNFIQTVIKDYREGKDVLPIVPTQSGGSTPVTGEVQPKNIKESGALARTMLQKLWGGGRQ